jgi:ketosteroid isomerase-like protein
MRRIKLHHLMLLLAVLSLVAAFARAQKPVPKAERDALLVTVTGLDTKLFDAYNHCDLKTLSEMVSDDLEFYHDQTGLAVGKASFLASMQQNICGTVQRTIVPGTLEAHELNGFGAVELVKHRFHHPGEDGMGEAESVMLWENKNGTWKLTRVISYDHHSLTN